MARPKDIRFFEISLPVILPEEKDWLPDYHRNCEMLVTYMEQQGAGSTAYYVTIRCLTGLRAYLLDKRISYSSENAEQWLRDTGPYPKGYQATLLRLFDMYTYSKVQPANAFPRVLPYAKNLLEPWTSLLSDYLGTLNHTDSSKKQIKNCVARFLFRIQEQGIKHPSEISFDLLESYIQEDGHHSKQSDARYTYAIGDILLYMADKGLCQHGLCWYPYFKMHNRILHVNDLTDDQAAILEQVRTESQIFTIDDLAPVITRFLKDFEAAGYSNSPYKTACYTLRNFHLFLAMHGLGYHKIIAEIWLEHEKTLHKDDGWKQARRVLRLFDLYLKEDKLVPTAFFREKPLLCDGLPPWCKRELDQYLSLKEREGWEQSTITMIRSSVTRFCWYLAGLGLSSFSEITPGILKDFNIGDKHGSIEGKNAYNGRIRKFIRFLERNGNVPYGIHQALSGTSAEKEKIVVILSESEKEAIKQKRFNSHSPIELRDTAMIMLGMRMGLRASDIVTIRITDIDWNSQTLRVLQEKTRQEILLPLPTDVGNAIYLYIRDGRPNGRTSSQYLFVKNKVPYDQVSRNACRCALKRFLPHRDVPGSGFHVTRKTYATERLCSGVGKQGIADLLGQRGTQSLRHYLQLDGDRMHLCPISLSESGLLLKGGRYGTL